MIACALRFPVRLVILVLFRARESYPFPSDATVGSLFFAPVTKNNTLSPKMLKTARDEYSQNPLTGFSTKNLPMPSAFLLRGGESCVENPVENVENIHFSMYKKVVKRG
jgi:hypothetical protein